MRLIDADALLSDIAKTIEESGCVNHESEIIDCIEYAPVIDIKPSIRKGGDEDELQRIEVYEHTE